ncbi:MAG: hypothetical protein LBT00_00670 [Spirochaetaceae bacterium]|nr:hypothetical protein [Spirochaetaceae bacterium]
MFQYTRKARLGGGRHCVEGTESSLRGHSPKQSRRGRPSRWIASLRSQ